ncbi:MAG: septation regulator SpoVG [Bacillota bacterium]
MQVTDVRIRKVLPEGKMKAIASITIDDEFVVRDVRVIEGTEGLFIAMPSRKTPEGTFRDVAHPITADAREMIQQAVL